MPAIDFDADSEKRLKRQTARAIQTLERHLKRANYRLLTQITRPGYDALMTAWRSHLLWMRLRLAYFKPFRPILLSRRKRDYQAVLDQMTSIAVAGIQRDGYELPDTADLRRVMRQFLAYTRRDRIPYPIPYLLKNGELPGIQSILVRFVEERLNLVEITQ
jgi:hypothetical protein